MTCRDVKTYKFGLKSTRSPLKLACNRSYWITSQVQEIEILSRKRKKVGIEPGKNWHNTVAKLDQIGLDRKKSYNQ